jgi:hypothetical protein
MHLVFAQLEKISTRIAHWNARLRGLLKDQLAITVSPPRANEQAVGDRRGPGGPNIRTLSKLDQLAWNASLD